MSITQLFVGGVLPYLALIGLSAGVVHRLAAWHKAPQPAKLTLYPTRGWGAGAVAKEVLFFPNLYKGDRPFWAMAWSFHAALALAFLGHFRAATGLVDSLLNRLGLGRGSLEALSTVAGGAAGVVLLVAVTTLIVRRVVLKRVREVSSLPDFLALFLLTAVIASGNLMRFGSAPVDLTEVRQWFGSLAAFSPMVPSNPAVLLHLFCAELLLLYLGFSKLMHFGGVFYSMSLVRRT